MALLSTRIWWLYATVTDIVCMRVCACVHVRSACVHVCMCMRACVCVCVCVCVWVRVSKCVTPYLNQRLKIVLCEVATLSFCYHPDKPGSIVVTTVSYPGVRMSVYMREGKQRINVHACNIHAQKMQERLILSTTHDNLVGTPHRYTYLHGVLYTA